MFGSLLEDTLYKVTRKARDVSLDMFNAGPAAAKREAMSLKSDAINNKLLSDQKAAADFNQSSSIASQPYGVALGGNNMQSQANKSGKKSILGGF